MSNHTFFYSEAELYDIAFDFKDIKDECNFIDKIFYKHTQKKVSGFLDIACGPGLHAIEFALRGVRSLGIDKSEQMIRYAQAKANKDNSKAQFLCADMLAFKLPQKVDVAGIFMDSTSYMLTNEDVIQHFRQVADNLNDDGLYVLEMSHPRDIFNLGQSTETSWDMKKENVSVHVEWGDASDEFNPITQVTSTSVTLTSEVNGQTLVVKDKAPQRVFTVNEFLALVMASGVFKVKEIYGAMNMEVAFTNKKEAWRMVPVLQKVNS